MENNKSNNFNWILIIAMVAIFLIIGIFWNFDRRQRIFERWKKKISKIRVLRRKLSELYCLKGKCDKRTTMVFWIGRTWLVGVVLIGAHWLHWEYNHVWYIALGYSLGIITITYNGIMFWWFANKYGLSEIMDMIENRIQCVIYRANDLDPVMIKFIEEQIEKLENEAMILKRQLRPEAQTG